ncbi:putative membrane protein [[Clostridium] cellulosi]|uniref:Putative membrane protein n=1 Tax=[Clostridium] cellulosi TaxID=29343 RepID=A0A078KLZ0_9FIRM|nr:putative membrane protein [[Clostridium] cellulosi]
MKIFKFFITKIFLRKVIIVFSVFLLLFLMNYLVFIAARSTVSTLQGYDEMKRLNQAGTYIANLDPNSNMNMGEIDKRDTQNVYDYLKNNNFNYALFTDGFIVSLPNAYDMEVSFAYLNEEYYKLSKQFKISQGKDLDFNYRLENNDVEIPVLIGKGLGDTYPIGSTIKVEDPVLQKQLTLKVQGILKPNVYHSNYYSLSSKQYYNFSVVIPVNENFLNNSSVDLQLNGLFNIILLQTSKDKIEGLHDVIKDNLGLEFKFHNQEENFEYFNEYYFSSLKTIALLTAIITLILTCLIIWSSLVSIRLMIKDFTINLLVGLSYSKLRKIFYGYYGLLFFINLVVLLIVTACSRYELWIKKDASFATFGLFGVIGMDWLSLLAALFFDIVIGIIVVEIMLWRIKKVPISLGVLQ